MNSTKRFIAIFIAMVMTFVSFSYTSAFAGQSNIDNIVNKIDSNVKSKKWEMVDKNIEDLEKTLRNEIDVLNNKVKVGKNPIGDRLKITQNQLQEIKAEYQAFYNTYQYYLKIRKTRTKQANTDIVAELVNQLSSLLGGVSTGSKTVPLSAAKKKNISIIKDQIKDLKTLDKMAAYILSRMNSLKAATREAQADRAQLLRLNQKYLTLMNFKAAPQYVWVRTEIVEFNKLDPANDTGYSVSGSSGNYTVGQTIYCSECNANEAYSASFAWNVPPERIKPNEVVKFTINAAMGSNTYKHYSSYAKMDVFFDNSDINPGFYAGAGPGLGTVSVGTSANYAKSDSKTVSAAPGNSYAGNKMALIFAIYNGRCFGTKYIYELKQVN